MENHKIFYVYVHRRKTDGSIFYVGKGKGSRKDHHYNKNKWWNRIAAKNGWYSEIIHENLSEVCAYCLEKVIIHSNKGRICNVALGGVGGSGFRHKSPEHIAKVAASQVGRPKSQETKNKISQKAKDRLKDKRKHWHLTLAQSVWVNKSGERFVGNHLELSEKTNLSLGGLKKVQSGALKSYRGWTCYV